MVVRSGCGVALVGYMSGRDTAQSLGYRQGVALWPYLSAISMNF